MELVDGVFVLNAGAQHAKDKCFYEILEIVRALSEPDEKRIEDEKEKNRFEHGNAIVA